MTDREIMQQALEGLEKWRWGNDPRGADIYIAALSERLAHCEHCGKRMGGEGGIHTCTPKQEPVDGYIASIIACREALDAQPVPPRYTTPPAAAQRQWVGLTDEEIHKTTILMGFNPEWTTEIGMAYSIVRNLEAKLKEKNT